MKTLRCALFVLAVIAYLLAPSVHAVAFSTDQSDLYFIPAESGWGMQLVQRNGTIFATLFVYDASTKPTWFTATMNPTPTPTPLQWTGDLYATTGPWFGTVPFNTANVTLTKVGTMTWTAQASNTGNVAYTVNGVAVSKNVIRQKLVLQDYSGHFGGGIHQTTTGCASPSVNGTVEKIGVIDISQSDGMITIAAAASSGACSYNGTLTQFGQMGDVVGSFLCLDGSIGTFHIFALQVTDLSVVAKFNASYSAPAPAAGCQATGWFGGTTITTF
jgi:hypothetical protein